MVAVRGPAHDHRNRSQQTKKKKKRETLVPAMLGYLKNKTKPSKKQYSDRSISCIYQIQIHVGRDDDQSEFVSAEIAHSDGVVVLQR